MNFKLRLEIKTVESELKSYNGDPRKLIIILNFLFKIIKKRYGY